MDGNWLESPLPQSTQEKIAMQLWGTANFGLQPYFRYYTCQCPFAFQSYGSKLPLKKNQDLVDIAKNILQGLTYHAVKEKLAEQFMLSSGTHTEDGLNASIDLAARLISMLEIGELRNAYSGRTKLSWREGPFVDFIRGIFVKQIEMEHDRIKLGPVFNVYNIVRIAGYKIVLTANLADHLLLRDSDKTITIFHHASLLMGIRDQQLSSSFPDGLVQETLQTLALLFPQGDSKTANWYKRQDKFEELDLNVLKCGWVTRRIEKFVYWHDRLVILKETFDESRPSTISQWWNDRRDRIQWYSLWIAISFTIFFGLLQSIEGGLQVYKVFNP